MLTKIIYFVLLIALFLWLVLMLGCGDSPVSHQLKDSSDFMVITVTDIYEDTKTYEATEIRYDQKNNVLDINLREGCGISIPEFSEVIKDFKVLPD